MKFRLIILLLTAIVVLPVVYPFIFKETPDLKDSAPPPPEEVVREEVPEETLVENIADPEPQALEPIDTATPEVRDPGAGILIFGQLPEKYLPRHPEPRLVVEAKPFPSLSEAETITDFYVPPEVRDPGSTLLVFGQLPERFLPRRADPALVVDDKPAPALTDPILLADALPELLEEQPTTPPVEQPASGRQAIVDPPDPAGGGQDFAPLRVLYPNQRPEALQKSLKIFALPVVVSLQGGSFKNRLHPFDIGPRTGRLAYAPVANGQGVVVVEDPRDGSVTPVTRPGGSAGMPVWSPDEAFLAYSIEQSGRSDIYIQNMATGAERRIIGAPHFAREPEWSPDGTRLAFSSTAEGSWDIWVMTLADGSLRRITSNAGAERSPKWSPDGSMLAFQADWQSSSDIWLVAVATGDLLALTEDGFDNYRPLWGPDGSEIAFVSTRTGASEIWSLDLETRNLLQVTEAGMDIDYPVYGPGGEEIHFVTQFEAAYLRGLTDAAEGWRWNDLEWWQTSPWLDGVSDAVLSPDGNTLAFRRQVAGRWQLFLYFYTRREARQITFAETDAHAPSWLGDGSGLVYSRFSANGAPSQIIRYTLIGAREAVLAEHAGAAFPIQCGDALYFLAPNANIPGRTALWRKSMLSGAPAERLTDTILSPEPISCAGEGVYVVSLESGLRAVHQYTPFDDSLTPLPIGPWTAERPIEDFEPSDDFNPVLSPDGTKVAFLSNRDGNTGIYLKYLDTNEVRRLTYTGEQESNLFWSANSKSLFTTSYLEEYTFRKVKIIDVFGSDFIGPV